MKTLIARKVSLIILLFFLLFGASSLKPKTISATILNENFNDGNTNGWIVVNEPGRITCSSPWIVENGELLIEINQGSCTTHLVPTDDLWNNLGDEYQIEVDMRSGGGTDHNIAFRFTVIPPNVNNWYDYHFIFPNSLELERIYGGTPSNSVNYNFLHNVTYHLKILVKTGNIQLSINNAMVLDYVYDAALERFPTGKFAFRASTGNDSYSKTYFDNLVIKSIDELLSPSPSPEPSLMPSPIPSPQPTKIPVVILPGFGGSWNTQALISGGDEGIWKKTPFVKIYDNLKQTFLNSGYTEGQNYFEFYYDWRKPLDSLAEQLKNFLETVVLPGKPESTKLNFVGHSMGGLIARTYGQKYGIDKINQLVTAGSPHQGAIPAWRLWSGAEIDDQWSFKWLGLKLYLQTQKDKFDSPIAAIQNLTPGLKDLTPTFDFAKNNNQVIPIDTMSFANNYLTGLNNNLTPNLKNIFNIVYGESGDNTVEWINLGERTFIDKLFGRWADGRPIDFLFTTQGDVTVLSKSAIINEVSSIATISGNHSEIVSETDGIQAILNALGLTGITPSTGTNSERLNPILFFFLHSPAQIKVTSAEGLEAGYGSAATLSDAIYSEEDKLLLIKNALSNYYQTEIIGQGDGVYGLEIGQLTDESDNWFNIENNINQGESDFYKVNLTQVKPADPLELAIYQLNKIKNATKSKKLIEKIDEIIKQLNYQRQNGLLDILNNIYSLDYKVNELDKAGKWLIETIEEPVKDRLKILTKLITAEEIKASEKFLELARKKLENKIKGENPEIGTRLELAEEYLAKAKADFEKGLYRRARAERKIVKIILHKLL